MDFTLCGQQADIALMKEDYLNSKQFALNRLQDEA
jgi:hypothetical protein